MKRKFLISLFAIICLNSFAQTQHGVVKTRGRMVNGQLVSGTKLSGVTITLNYGNSLVSGMQGTFSFNVPSGIYYSLVSAKKQGYTLADPEFTNRSFTYSSNTPFYVVLEDENQRQADINAATRKVRKTLAAQLEKLEEEIEELKAKNQLTEKEYQDRLQELYDNQTKSEQLVKEMSERYASTDYDQLDEFNRQIQMYIEEGELIKADSMIQSKGSLDMRIAKYHQVVAANKAEREELTMRNYKLKQSESASEKTFEELTQDLYSKYSIAIQQYLWDDAKMYLKQRADLDTTNVDNVWDYAYFCYNQKYYSDCEKYYLICLRIQEQLFSTNPEVYRKDLAGTQNNLGNLYSFLHDYVNSEKFLKLSLDNREFLFSKEPDRYRADLSKIHGNLGNLYSLLHDYVKSEKYFKMALENCEIMFAKSPKDYIDDLLKTQNNLGILYIDLHDFANSEKYYKLALENCEKMFAVNPDDYIDDLAMAQHNLGTLYSYIQDYERSEHYYRLSLENKEKMFAVNPDANRADLALTQRNLGALYRYVHDYANSEKFHVYALENYEKLYASNPNAYRKDWATINWNIMVLYIDLDIVEKYSYYLEKTLKIYQDLYKFYPSIYNGNLANCYNLKANNYIKELNFDKALETIDEAIELMPRDANLYDSKGEILLLQGKNEEALKMWEFVLDINPNFLNGFPEGTALSNGLKQIKLIK